MPTRLYTWYDFDSDWQRFKPCHNNSGSFENKVMSYIQRMIPASRIETFYTTGTQKDWFVQCRWVLWTLPLSVWNNVLFLSTLSMSTSTTCSKWQRNSTWNKKRGQRMKCGNNLLRRKVTLSSNCGKLNDGNSTRLMNVSVKEHLRKSFPRKRLCVRTSYWRR